MAVRISNEDLIRLYGERYDPWTKETRKNRVIFVYYWGDEIDVIDEAEADDPLVKSVRVRLYHYSKGEYQEGTIRKKSAGRRDGVTHYRPFKWRNGPMPHLLETIFIDVQQGDATLIRTPDRKIILIDGGEGKFIARLMAAMFPGTTEDKPLYLDALVITHGDADHFSGLTELKLAPQHDMERKRIHTRIARYYHNGLVKPYKKITDNGTERKRKEKEKLGDFKTVGKRTYVTSLFDDPRDAPSTNEPFAEWNDALSSMLLENGSTAVDRLDSETLPRVERLEFGQHDRFDIFRSGGVDIKVLGPLVEGSADAPVLEFLKSEKGISASHTINGHSVILKMKYGNVRFLLGGDLNTHSQERLVERISETHDVNLKSEILKVPHHGSHEFDYEFLHKINPVVSVVSSGDENAMKEYIHPRANLMAALGFCSRRPRPLLFCTELAAFFAYRGPVLPEQHKTSINGKIRDLQKNKKRGKIHAFQRLIFGAVRFRTDGDRVMVAVESANDGVKEAYAFHVDGEGEITMDEVTVL